MAKEWNPSMSIAKTTVPWAARWLACYELWEATGRWHGGGRHMKGDPSLDHNFCLSRARGTLRDVLWLTGRGGLTLTLATTEPGVQVYDGRDAIRPLRSRYEGLALEPQFWPDALSHPDFPSVLLAPGQAWQQQTRWRFSR
ncbi:MAG: hypothetical protein KBG46_08165 [Paracoccus sp.]|nr:hypothetical protein [Paracoccus sp. (in: a-proteobacteria)]